MKPATYLSTSLLALAMFSAPAIAQQRPQDFTLPPGGTPTPTPEAAGPVDEAAGVTIPPRTIRTPTPTPTPAPAIVQPIVEPTPTPTPSPAPARSQPSTTQPRGPAQPATIAPTPAPTAAAPDAGSDGPAQQTQPTPPNFTLPTPEPIAPAGPTGDMVAEKSSSSLPDWWPWAAALFGALLIGGAGGWAFARKRGTAPPAPIEPPVVPAQPVQVPNVANSEAPKPPRINLEVESLQRSVMMMTARYGVSIANRSDKALRDVKVFADLVSARRDHSMEQQVATLTCDLPEAGAIERIGPQQMGTYRGQLQLPVDQLEVFRQGQTPLCVPLVRVRVEATGLEPQCHTFLVGIGGGHVGGRVQPLPLTGPPGGFTGVQTKRIDAPA